MLAFLLLAFIAPGFSQNISCKDLPDVFPADVTFCAYDGKTHETKKLPQFLSIFCGIAVNYPGVCGCPSNCNNNTFRGRCINGQCLCKAGWKGSDCGLVDCAGGNRCNNRGQCKTKFINQTIAVDLCVCHANYTGPYCETTVLPNSFNNIPYGQPLGPQYWPASEPYKEHHPIFNRSVLATIHIRLPEALLQSVRSTNIENSTYVPAQMLFHNGNVEIATPIGLKLKGYSSRRYAKKSWKIKFTDEKIYGLKRFGLKANSQEQSGQRGFHEADLLRAAGVPSCRNSHANLFINDMYFGLFWLEETLDDTWIKSRYETNKGSFYKVAGAMLQNLGPNPEIYKTFKPFGLPPSPIFDLGAQAYELKYGKNDSYQDLAALAQLSNTSQANFEARIAGLLDVDLFIRSVIVVTAVVNIDCFSISGNNYMLYNLKQKDNFKFVTSDFDLAFGNLPQVDFPGPGNTSIPQSLIAPLTWGSLWPNNFLPEILSALPNNFTQGILHSKKYKAQFLSDYQVFVDKVFQFEPMFNRWKILETFLQPYINTDQWYHLDNFGSPATVAHDVNTNVQGFLANRTRFLQTYLQNPNL